MDAVGRAGYNVRPRPRKPGDRSTSLLPRRVHEAERAGDSPSIPAGQRPSSSRTPLGRRSSSWVRCGACAAVNGARRRPGPIVRWHSHLVCVKGDTTRHEAARREERCPAGARLRQGTEMLHVWFTGDLRSAYSTGAPVPRALQGRDCSAAAPASAPTSARISWLLPCSCVAIGAQSASAEAAHRARPLDGRAPTARRDTYGGGGLPARELCPRPAGPILRIFSGTRRLRLQILRAGPELHANDGRHHDERRRRHAAAARSATARPGKNARVRIGPWPSGVYFARLERRRRPHRLRAVRRPPEPARQASTSRSSCRRSRGRRTTSATRTRTASATAGTRARAPNRTARPESTCASAGRS